MRLNYRRCRDEVMIVESRGPLAIEPYLRALVDSSGSDLHLKAGVVPRIRVDGTLHPLRSGPLSPADTERMLSQIIRDDLVEEFDQTGEADFALMIDGVGRFRVNAFRQRGDTGHNSVGYFDGHVRSPTIIENVDQIAMLNAARVRVNGVHPHFLRRGFFHPGDVAVSRVRALLVVMPISWSGNFSRSGSVMPSHVGTKIGKPLITSPSSSVHVCPMS